MSYKVQNGGYTFTLELDAPLCKGKLSFPLVDFLPKDMSGEGLRELKQLVDKKAEAAWVHSRLMVAFSYTAADEEDRSDVSMVEASFRATEEGQDEEDATLFSCWDDKGRAKVHFDAKTKKETAKKIATAFWKVLLAEPSELDDYEGEIRDKSGARVPFGVRDGRCFFGDDSEEDVDIDVTSGRDPFDFDPMAMEEEDDDWGVSDFYGRNRDDDDDDNYDDDY